ncbi:hypothetical protein HHI36_018865 [Cryptolaemus montrouzieri]|uniref:Kinetochore protein Nuf2 N-terminal domain-containing protein n=1 Tax=Cryptolaemus montrouzieri TaxID=559131 RepID=A0ABD2P1C4_9CUCU
MSTKKGLVNLQKNSEITEKNIQTLVRNIKNFWPNFAINARKFQNPTPTFVYQLYSLFYFDYEKKLSEIKNKYFNAEEQEVFDKSLDEIVLAIKLRQISKQIGLSTPFTLNDMCEPGPHRTIIFTTMFINLLTYVTSDTDYEEDISEASQKINKFKELYENKQCLLEKIQDLDILHVTVEENIRKLSQEIDNLSEEYKEISLQKATREFEYQKYLKIKDKLQDDIKLSDEQIVKLRENCILSQEQIVENEDIEKLQNKISALFAELEILNSDRSNILLNLERQEESTKHFNKCLELLQKSDFSEEHLNAVKNCIVSVADVSQEINNLKNKINDKKIELEKLQQHKVSYTDDILVLEKELAVLKEDTIKEKQLLIDHFNDLSEKYHKDLITKKQHEDDISEIQGRISDLKEDISLLKAGVKEEYVKLIENQSEIYNAFNSALIEIDDLQRVNQGADDTTCNH